MALSIDKRSIGAIFLANTSKLSPTVTPSVTEYANCLALHSASTFYEQFLLAYPVCEVEKKVIIYLNIFLDCL